MAVPVSGVEIVGEGNPTPITAFARILAPGPPLSCCPARAPEP